MRAIIDNHDCIIRLTTRPTEGIDIGLVPGGVGLHRLRWDGSQIVDLADLSQIYVARRNGVWSLHAVAAPESQLVTMTFSQRKRLVEEQDGTFRVLSDQEWNDKQQAAADDVADNRALRQELVALVRSLTFAKIDDRIDNVWGDLTTAMQRDAMKEDMRKAMKVLLALAKKQLGK